MWNVTGAQSERSRHTNTTRTDLQQEQPAEREFPSGRFCGTGLVQAPRKYVSHR